MARKGNDLSGVRIAHDFDDFVEDRELVLTLKDTYVINNQEVNDDIDVLENIDMAENYRHQVQIENRTKKTGYLEGKYGGEKKILPQYDEKPTEKDGIILDSHGEYDPERIRKLESIRSKLSNPNKKGGEMNLETQKNVASEYYTSEEMKKFKKPMKKAPTVQKNKDDILKFLEESLGDTNDDHGNRDTRKARDRADLEDMVSKKQKTENYETALQKARDQTKFSAQLDEEYEDIQRAIEQQRKSAQNKKMNPVEEVVRTLIESKPDPKKIENKDYIVLNSVKKRPTDGEVVDLDTINTSTDFLKTVPTKDYAGDHRNKIAEPTNFSLKDTRDGTTSVVNISLPSEKILAWNKSQSDNMLFKKKDTTGNKDKATEEDDSIFTQEEINKLAEEVKFIEEDQYAGSVANVLKAAREKGYLNENEIEIAGRSKDKTYREELAKFKGNDDKIRLEYRDSKGRIMTPKEAFRYQCRIFHGINPSKNKQEKEKKKYEAAKKHLTTAPQETPSMKALTRLQKQTNQPYVVLDTRIQK